MQTGGVLTVRRGVFEDNHEAAAAAVGLGSAATLHDIVLRTTKPRACVPGCPNEGGDGLAALDGAHVEATHFSVVGNVACGVQVADSSTMDLSDGFVSANRIGACVQGAAFDTARLSANVKYVANDTAFSGDFVPLPTQLAAPISLPGH